MISNKTKLMTGGLIGMLFIISIIPQTSATSYDLTVSIWQLRTSEYYDGSSTNYNEFQLEFSCKQSNGIYYSERDSNLWQKKGKDDTWFWSELGWSDKVMGYTLKIIQVNCYTFGGNDMYFQLIEDDVFSEEDVSDTHYIDIDSLQYPTNYLHFTNTGPNNEDVWLKIIKS